MQVRRLKKAGKLTRFFYVSFEMGGKQLSRSTGCDTEPQAKAWAKRYVENLRQQRSAEGLAEAIREIKTGGRQISLADALKRHETRPRRKQPAAGRAKQVARVWEDFAAWATDHGADHVAAVSPEIAEGWVSQLRDHGRYRSEVQYRRRYARQPVTYQMGKKLTPTSVNDYTQMAKMVMQSNLRDAGIVRNPFDNIDRMEKKPNRRHAFSRDEVARILDAATPEVGQLVTVAICTGLRLGDCCRLEWAYIDLAAGWIRRDLSKTGTRIRMPIMPRLRAMLESLPRDGQWVLPTWAKMYADNRSGVSSRIQQALTAAGVKTGPDRRDFHSFRHAFIWQAAESGIPLPVVQAMVGHLTPAMTALYADHATEQATLAAVARLPDPVTAITRQPAAADLSAMTTADLMAEISRRLAR